MEILPSPMSTLRIPQEMTRSHDFAIHSSLTNMTTKPAKKPAKAKTTTKARTEAETKEKMPEQELPPHLKTFDPNIVSALSVAAEQNLPVLLVGETGTGKTTLIREEARAAGKMLYLLS